VGLVVGLTPNFLYGWHIVQTLDNQALAAARPAAPRKSLKINTL
jgi:hypothetical protein